VLRGSNVQVPCRCTWKEAQVAGEEAELPYCWRRRVGRISGPGALECTFPLVGLAGGWRLQVENWCCCLQSIPWLFSVALEVPAHFIQALLEVQCIVHLEVFIPFLDLFAVTTDACWEVLLFHHLFHLLLSLDHLFQCVPLL